MSLAVRLYILGIRVLGTSDEDDTRTVASMEALSLIHNYEYIDIYSNSWGPDDDGKTMELLAPILYEAFNLTINEVCFLFKIITYYPRYKL